MSMLAEHKRKTKWVINPTKKPLWTTDSSGIQFGKQLMEKMGWSAGKGLGVNEQGIQEPLKVAFKNDNKGMGFKENLDDWIEHQDEFNDLLNQLRSNNDTSVIKDSGDEKTEIKSLEEKSKQSRARVHYQKFTRGKDLSKYTANDLACILGTNKTRKEKLKIEDVIETETKVNGNCETSFGVTTINSGSIQDYFKKKWIIDKVKKIDSAGDKFEESKEDFNNENYGFSVHEEETVKLENEEKKSRKRKHTSSSDFEPLCAKETKLPEFDETENVKSIEKKKKKKKREQEVDERNEKGCLDENFSDKEHYVLEESYSNNSNTVKKRKKDKNHKELQVTNSEGQSKTEIKSKKAKKNTEESTTQDELPAEKIHDIDIEDSTLELIKRKKKKKSRKEETEENEMFETHYDAVDMNVAEPVKNKKRKTRESEKSEGNNNKDFSSVQDIHSRKHIKDSNVNVQDPEILVENKDATDIKSKKKKNKKKYKKEKELNFDDKYFYNYNQEVPSDGKFELDIENLGKINDDIPELVLGMKKKKKKKENVDENKEIAYENQHNQIQECSEKIAVDGQGEDISVVEPVMKKKKKSKKEKSMESVDCSLEEEKGKVPFEGENTVNIEFVKKKKKKKEKSEKVEGTENKSDQLEHTRVAKNNSDGVINEIEKSDNGVICTTNYNSNNSNIEGRVLNSNTEVEKRLQKLSTNLFGDKAAEKYFPEQQCNERVLKLIRWANISEFRGSNLKNIDGYGRQKEYEKQFR